MPGAEGPAGRAHDRAVDSDVERLDRRLGDQLGPAGTCARLERRHARVRVEHPAAGQKHRLRTGRDPERWKSGGGVTVGQPLQLDALLLRKRHLARQLVAPGLGEEQCPAVPVELLTRLAFERRPPIEGGREQLDVLGRVVEEPERARAPVRRTLAVAEPELVDPDRVDAVRCQGVERRGTEHAESDHDHVDIPDLERLPLHAPSR